MPSSCIAPDSAMLESCMELTDPVEMTVVAMLQ